MATSKQKIEYAKSKMTAHTRLLRKIYKYMVPSRFDDDDGLYDVYDSTAADSASRLANNLKEGIFPMGSMWAYVLAETEEGVKKAVLVNKMLLTIMETSNFQEVIYAFFLDLIVGTATLRVDYDQAEQAFKFEAVSNLQVAFINDSYGQAVEHYRFYKMNVEEARAKYGDSFQASSGEIMHNFVEGTYKQGGVYKYDIYDGGSEYGVSNKEKASTQVGKLLSSTDVALSPYITIKWLNKAGDQYGYGPGVITLPTVMQLNMHARDLSMRANLESNPPLLINQNALLDKTQVDVSPGSIIYTSYDSMTQTNVPVQALVLPTANVLSIPRFQDLQMAIKRGFHDDSLPERNADTPLSATEINKRISDLSKRIGGPVARIATTLPRQIVDKILTLLKVYGIIDLEGLNLAISTPFHATQVQKEGQDILNTLQAISSVDPSASHYTLNMTEVMYKLVRSFGITDQNLLLDHDATLRAKKQVDETLAKQQQAQQQQAQQQ